MGDKILLLSIKFIVIQTGLNTKTHICGSSVCMNARTDKPTSPCVCVRVGLHVEKMALTFMPTRSSSLRKCHSICLPTILHSPVFLSLSLSPLQVVSLSLYVLLSNLNLHTFHLFSSIFALHPASFLLL